jgi:adenylate cyclase
MLTVRITNDKQNEQFEYAGAVEFGRAAQREVQRCRLDDIYVSRDHLRLDELPDGRVRLENLSTTRPVIYNDDQSIPIGGVVSLDLPLQLILGKTRIDLRLSAMRAAGRDEPTLGAETGATCGTGDTSAAVPCRPREDAEPFDQNVFQSLTGKSWSRAGKKGGPQANGSGSVQETLAQWLETVIALQQAAPESAQFYRQVAEALTELIGLDLGMVLLRRNGAWTVAGVYTTDDTVPVRYSRTLLEHIAKERITVYQDLTSGDIGTSSLSDIEAVVASPIFGRNEEIVGVLYGTRLKLLFERGGVQALEAQLVQLLGETVGAHIARAAALQTRVQFEQFFTPELVRELECNPDLLEGRSQEVTVLSGDLRGFTQLSQRLGANNTCRLVRDIMERLTDRIREHDGVIVDYAGDGVLAMWNAPSPQPDHAARACLAALDMLSELPGLNQKWHHLAEGALALGIGVNTGIVQVGNTGTSRKFKYGPHGHAVNLASRVQEATKKLGLPLLITDATRALLPPDLAIRRLGRVRLPGVQEPVVLHELKGRRAPLGWEECRDTYERALSEYEAGRWAQACQRLLPLLEDAGKHAPLDAPTLKLLRRAGECLESRPDPFDPIIEMTVK